MTRYWIEQLWNFSYSKRVSSQDRRKSPWYTAQFKRQSEVTRHYESEVKVYISSRPRIAPVKIFRDTDKISSERHRTPIRDIGTPTQHETWHRNTNTTREWAWVLDSAFSSTRFVSFRFQSREFPLLEMFWPADQNKQLPNQSATLESPDVRPIFMRFHVLRFEWNNTAIFTVNIYIYYCLRLTACRNMV